MADQDSANEQIRSEDGDLTAEQREEMRTAGEQGGTQTRTEPATDPKSRTWGE